MVRGKGKWIRWRGFGASTKGLEMGRRERKGKGF